MTVVFCYQSMQIKTVFTMSTSFECNSFRFSFKVKVLNQIPPKQNNTKIDVNSLKEFYSSKESFQRNSAGASAIEYYKILESTLSKQLPPERYNGIINLFYILLYPDATSEEIASTLVIYAVLLIQ